MTTQRILIINKIIEYFNLESELNESKKIHDTIIKDAIIKGTNLWILIFAIIIASVGLNMNSTAVIIGAMLISPLMGPINGMGYSIATYNSELFKRSVKSYTFAVIASLLTSTIYFSISPISTAHSELLARTSPTIYDVLIALFGGLAGIIAISSKQKGNVIAGAAIATALMPPLCTAGYGLATAQFHFFFGAMYLFTINSVFIALASVAISQLLKFPIRTLVDAAQKRKVNKWISIVLIAVLLPSIYFGYSLIKKEKFKENANNYIQNVSIIEGNYLLKSDVDSKKNEITLIYGGKSLTNEQKELITLKASNFNIDRENLVIKQGLTVDNIDASNKELYLLKEKLSQAHVELENKKSEVDSLSNKKEMGKLILNEIRTFHPEIEACTFAESYMYKENSTKAINTTIVIFTLKNAKTGGVEKEKIENWLKTRLNVNSIDVIYR